MNHNNYASNFNVGFADTVVIHSYIDPRPAVVDQINVDTVVNDSMINSRPVVVDQINVY